MTSHAIIDRYTCIECYTAYQVEVTDPNGNGTSSIAFNFDQAGAMQHIADTVTEQAPSHSFTPVFVGVHIPGGGG